MPVWDIFNNFLFLGLLKDIYCVKWVDPGFVGKAVGRLEINNATPGPRAWMYVQRPTPMVPSTLQVCLKILLHEMCHALLYLACQCNICGCHLNRINGEGMRYHGPAWQSVRRSVEDTANLLLTGLYRPFLSIFAMIWNLTSTWRRKRSSRRYTGFPARSSRETTWSIKKSFSKERQGELGDNPTRPKIAQHMRY